MSATQFMAARIRKLALFCLARGAGCYAGWTGEKIFKYLAFQWFTNGLFVCTEGKAIGGVLIAWPASAERILQREVAGDFHFAWEKPVDGDALMIADVIANKRSASRLVQMASAQWPDWKMRRLFTHRRGRLVELQPRAIERWIAHVSSFNS